MDQSRLPAPWLLAQSLWRPSPFARWRHTSHCPQPRRLHQLRHVQQQGEEARDADGEAAVAGLSRAKADRDQLPSAMVVTSGATGLLDFAKVFTIGLRRWCAAISSRRSATTQLARRIRCNLNPRAHAVTTRRTKREPKQRRAPHPSRLQRGRVPWAT